MTIQIEKLSTCQSGVLSLFLFNKLDIHFNTIRVLWSPNNSLQKNDTSISELIIIGQWQQYREWFNLLRIKKDHPAQVQNYYKEMQIVYRWGLTNTLSTFPSS